MYTPTCSYMLIATAMFHDPHSETAHTLHNITSIIDIAPICLYKLLKHGRTTLDQSKQIIICVLHHVGKPV